MAGYYDDEGNWIEEKRQSNIMGASPTYYEAKDRASARAAATAKAGRYGNDADYYDVGQKAGDYNRGGL